MDFVELKLPLGTSEVLRILPHREPFVFVDGVVEVELQKRILAFKNVALEEPHFRGHFPGHPVMPGVLQIEALAQALGILVYFSKAFHPDTHLAYLAGVDEVKFRRIVTPGERLDLDVELLGMKRGIYKARGVTRVGGEIACQATIIAAVVAKT